MSVEQQCHCLIGVIPALSRRDDQGNVTCRKDYNNQYAEGLEPERQPQFQRFLLGKDRRQRKGVFSEMPMF